MKYFCLLFCFLSLALHSQVPGYEDLSRKVFSALKSGHPEKIAGLFDTTGLGKLVKAQSLAMLASSEDERGKARKLISYQEDEEGCKTKTGMLISFKKEKAMLYITFNDRKQIQHISFDKPAEQPFFQLQGYKGLAEVTDIYIDLKTRDGLTLQGNVAFSDTSKKKIPIVVFVHGSGPNDRDETMGPNKFFRDLAQGLAQKGIASFRYDKRTYAYQFNMKPRSDSMTLYEETINDALDAVKRAKQLSFVDTSQVYVIGHSQGAMCAPKIAELAGTRIKGIIMMAAPARSLVDIIPDQIRYMAMLDDTISTQEQMQITAVTWMTDKIKSPGLDQKTPSGMLMGASAMYWKSILAYNQVSTAKALSLPMFIVNGESDYQVPMTEFNLWKKDLEGRQNVSFKAYPGLSHLFMQSREPKPGPKDYEAPQHIPQYVIDDLADFMLRH